MFLTHFSLLLGGCSEGSDAFKLFFKPKSETHFLGGEESTSKTLCHRYLLHKRVSGDRNVLVCREAPVTYRKDMALEDTWHEKVGTVGLNHTMVSRMVQW